MCRSLLQKLKDEQASAVRNQQYPAASCPICFEDLAKPDGASTLPSAASTSKDGQSGSDQGGSSSKSDVAPSAPPLDAHPERESLLGKSKTQDGFDTDTHEHSRCVQRLSPAVTVLLVAMFYTLCCWCMLLCSHW